MNKAILLGSLDLASGAQRQVSLAGFPVGNEYLESIWIDFTITTSDDVAGAAVGTAIGGISLLTGNHRWVDNLTANDLIHVCINTGTMTDKLNNISGATTAHQRVVIPFRFSQLVEPYDTMPHVAQVKTNSYILFNSGAFDTNITSIRADVYGIFKSRKNVYAAPQIRLNKYTITTEGSGSVKVPNAAIFASFVFGVNTSNYNGTIALNGETFLSNAPIKGIDDRYRDMPLVNLGDDPYADYAVVPAGLDRKESLSDVLLPANSVITYKDFNDDLVPFNLITVELVPVSVGGGSPVVESSVAPLKI